MKINGSSGPRPAAARPKVLFLYIVYGTVFFLSPFTVSNLDPGHLVVLLPFPQIATALFL